MSPVDAKESARALASPETAPFRGVTHSFSDDSDAANTNERARLAAEAKLKNRKRWKTRLTKIIIKASTRRPADGIAFLDVLKDKKQRSAERSADLPVPFTTRPRDREQASPETTADGHDELDLPATPQRRGSGFYRGLEMEPTPPTVAVARSSVTSRCKRIRENVHHVLQGELASKELDKAIYAEHDQGYLDFLCDLERASAQNASPEQDQEFASWIRDLDECTEQADSLSPRKLFADDNDSSQSPKKVGFSPDTSVRLFSRTKDELLQLRQKTISSFKSAIRTGDTEDADWSIRRFFGETLKTVEESVKTVEESEAWKTSVETMNSFFRQENLKPIICACEVPVSREGNDSNYEPSEACDSNSDTSTLLSFADNLGDDPDEYSQEDVDQSEHNESFHSVESCNSSPLWFAVPYNVAPQDANSDVISSIARNRAIASTYIEQVYSRESTSSSVERVLKPSVSMDRKKQVVRDAKRWAASKRTDTLKNEETGVENSTKKGETAFVESSEDQGNRTDKDDSSWHMDTFDEEHDLEESSVAFQPTETAQEETTAGCDIYSVGPDPDETNEWVFSPPRETAKEERPSAGDTSADRSDANASREWAPAHMSQTLKNSPDKAELGPDLDESNEWLACQIKADFPDLDDGKEWVSFSEPTEDAHRKSLGWSAFPATHTAHKATLTSHNDAPEVNEANGRPAFPTTDTTEPTKFASRTWEEFPKNEVTKTPPRAVSQAGSNAVAVWKRRVVAQRTEPATKSSPPTPQDVPVTRAVDADMTMPSAATTQSSSRVRDLVRAFEQPTPHHRNDYIISPLTVSSGLSWADTSHEFPEDHPDLQQPILDSKDERRPGSTHSSPVSVAFM